MLLKQEYLTLQKASMSSLKKAMAQIKAMTVGEMETNACVQNEPATRNGKCKDYSEVLCIFCCVSVEEPTYRRRFWLTCITFNTCLMFALNFYY